ncbi:MAG: PilC/PilY family type IV pilus protein [Burkholderiales bacterium]|nr:PilC/PilY family type IV pilus protein [Burkholderiales bacterium]
MRTDIVPGRTYNKYPNRTDCVAQEGVCTYAEEMTNFANWFAYYRTRIQAAKTAIGRAIALAAIPDNWRLGFKTINFAASRYLPVAPFTSGAGGHRQQWYQKLYEAPAASGTPLRLALSRAGRYFGNRNPDGMGPTPINSACQPNFVILTSDGYWNDSGTVAQKLDGSAIGDADGDGYANTLADVAYYYYHTDLMPSLPNQVPAAGIDNAPHQHMTTFTVGMGIEGTLLFHPNYLERGNSLDYDAITDGNPATTPNNWPQPVADTETAVDDMWHAAVNGRGRFFSVRDPEALANGINQVLTAIAQRVGAGAAAATSNLQPVAGDNFAFTAQYTTVEWSGDLKARTIRLTDGLISGRELWSASALLDQRSHTDRRIYTFDPADTVPGAVITVNGASRVQNGNRLRSFCSHTDAALPTCDDGGLLTPQEANDYFNPLGGPNGALSQTAGWPSGDPRRVAATPGSLIRYLRGDAANEIALGGTSSTDLYRNRAHLLGDIVNAQPAYVKAAPFNYSPTTDPYYLDFKNRTNGTAGTRKGTVYVAANDGMLHAFETDPDNNPYYQTAGIENPDTNPGNDAFTGTLNTDPITGEGAERWAYIPTLVFPTLKRLAEANYSSNHRFFVDGSPAVGDVCFGHTLSTPCASVNNWRTILVAGLNAGGRGYYALDITDPDNPKGLWELKGGSGAACLTDAQANSGEYGEDCNIGLTFGNPIIAKRPEDGRWVVFVTSGYNNVSPGDGKGYLYIVDAQTGKILRRMSTGLGSTGTPSGLGRINAWVDQATVNNTARAVYGGDLQGNVWRFQLEEQASPAIPRYSVTKLATVYDPSNNPQPITAKPELAEVAGKRVVVIGTGRFLGASDKTDNQRQSIYAIKDDLAGAGDSTPFNDPPQVNMTRSSPTTIPGFVRQELTENSTSTRIATNNPVDFTAHHGWFIDLPGGGSGGEAAERVNIDPSVQLGTLVVASNVPSNETCVAGGYGWVNFLNVASGATVATGVSGTPASVKIAASLIVGINVVKIGEQVKTVVTTADNQQITEATPTVPSGVQGRRVSWREVFVE